MSMATCKGRMPLLKASGRGPVTTGSRQVFRFHSGSAVPSASHTAALWGSLVCQVPIKDFF